MQQFGLGCLLGLAVLFGAGSSAHADEYEDEQARTIEALHAFGVRGLPGAYAEAADSKGRARAIQLGLEWLAAHQRPDGSWRPDELHWCHGKEQKDGAPTGKGKALYTVGVTGMVVTAFLGAGHTHRGKHPFAKTVRTALTWLVAQQDPEGCVGPRRTQQYVYNHAFGTLALLEAYALTGDPKLRGPAQKAIDFSALARNPYMAWRYGVKPGDNDTSVTGCMGLPLYVALRLNRAGERAHVFEPLGLDDTVFDGIRSWIGRMVDEDTGRAGYISRGTGPARPMEAIDEFPGEKSESCTAITVFLRTVLPGWQRSPADTKQSQRLIDKGVQLMLDLKPAWTLREGNIDFYYWYYATMAMRQVGGAAWEAWDAALAPALLNSQHAQGDVCGVRGSWDPAGVWAKTDGGRIYATAICLLMLETPDRMRPLPPERTDLLDALHAKELTPTRRATILRGLGLLDVPKAGPEVAKWLSDEDEQVCAAAAEALGRLDAGSKGVKVLAGLLGDKRTAVRRAAVTALAGQGKHLRPVIDRLIQRMGDEDVYVAAGAARALGASEVPDVASALKPRLAGGDIALRVAAAAAIQRLGGETTDALPVLIDGLKAKAARVRIEAAEAIAAMEGADLTTAEKPLAQALLDESPTVRVHAAAALLFTAGRTARRADCLQAWMSALDSPSSRDRSEAMARLALLGDPAPTSKLAAQLLTGPTSLRIGAANALAAAGRGALPAAATLSWCSANGPSGLRKAASNAYDALQVGPAEAVQHLLPVFTSATPDARVFEGAARALAFQGAPVVGALTDQLATGNLQQRRWMLAILARMGQAAAPAVPAIARELEDTKDIRQKERAIRALGAIGPGASSALPQLAAAFGHESLDVRLRALEAIGVLARTSPQALQLVLTASGDKDKKRRHIRLAALRVLGMVQEQAERVIPSLLMALDDDDHDVRSLTIDALAGLWPASEELVGKALTEAGPKVRNGAAQVIERVGEPAKKLIKPLVQVLEGGNFSGNTKYADALAAIGKPAVRALLKLLRHPTPKVRAEAARALGRIGPDAKRALGGLRKLLGDPDFNVQMRAREAIDLIKPKRR